MLVSTDWKFLYRISTSSRNDKYRVGEKIIQNQSSFKSKIVLIFVVKFHESIVPNKIFSINCLRNYWNFLGFSDSILIVPNFR